MHHRDAMLDTYLDQLDQEAARVGVDLSAACARAGVAATTLQRWRRGEVSPREGTAKLVLAEIIKIASEGLAPTATAPPNEVAA